MPNLTPADFAKNIAKYPITQMFTIPPLLRFLTRTPQDPEVLQRLASMTSIICAAAPLGPELQAEFKEKIRLASPSGTLNVRIMQAWGMTELTTIV